MGIPFLNNIIINSAGHVQFKTTAGADAGKIDQVNNDLVISNAIGDVLLGDGSSDVYIGDGVNNVDILFEQSGNIKADDSASNVTLTLGSSNTSLALISGSDIPITGSLNITGNVAVDTNVLFVDTVNNRVGIGTASPSFKLDVDGDVRVSQPSKFTFANGQYLKDDGSAGLDIASISEAGSINFITNSTDKMIITSAGNVGIGTTTPGEKLHVDGNIRVQDSTDTIYSNRFRGINNADVELRANNGYDLILNGSSGDNVGIGTTTPSNKLEVVEARSGSSASDQTKYTLVSRSTIASGQTPGTGGIKVVYDDGSNEHAFGLVAGSTSADFLTSGPMHWYTNSDLNTNSATGFAMTIDTSQRVGIGTTSPSSPLTVKSNSTSSGNSGLRIEANGSTDAIVLIGEKSGNKARFHMYNAGVEKIAFYTDGTDNHILEGNVGIGVSNPSSFFNQASNLVIGGAGNIGATIYSSNSGNSFLAFADVADGANSGFNAGGSIYYEHSTDSMVTRVNGAERLRIEANGDVGIGTTQPGQKLEVNGNVRANRYYGPGGTTYYVDPNDTTQSAYFAGDIRITDSGTATIKLDSTSSQSAGASIIATKNGSESPSMGSITWVENPGFVGSIWSQRLSSSPYTESAIQLPTSSSYDFNIKVLGSNRMTIDSSTGNVGIGTTAPNTLIHAFGSGNVAKFQTTSFGGINLSRVNNVGNNSTHFAISFNNSDSEIAYIKTLNKTGGTTSTGTGYEMQFATLGSGYQTFYTNGSERMRINSSGNVGIGTTSPDTILEVVGENPILTIRDTSTGLSSANSALRIAESDSGDTLGNYWDLKIKPESIGGTTNFAIANSILGDVFNINYQAKVGIGTTSPQAKLEVGDCESSGNIDDGNIAVKTNSNNTAIVIQESSGAEQWGLGVNSDGDFVLTDSGTERVRIDDNTGNFGIGTTAPAEKLVVSGDDDVSIRIYSTKNGTWTTDQLLGAYEFYGNDASGSGAQIKGKIDCASLNQYGAGFHMRFFTAGGGAGTSAIERMRINSSGAVTIGKTAPSSYNTQGIDLSPSGLASFTRSGNVSLLVNRTGSDGQVVSIRNDNTSVGSISVSGSTTSYNTSSDYRLKENVVDMTGAIERIEQLQPKRFNFISNAEKTVDGFIAHEVQNIIPEAVLGEKDGIDENGEPEYQEMDNSKIVPLLVGAIKELKAEIENLKSQIN